MTTILLNKEYTLLVIRRRFYTQLGFHDHTTLQTRHSSVICGSCQQWITSTYSVIIKPVCETLSCWDISCSQHPFELRSQSLVLEVPVGVARNLMSYIFSRQNQFAIPDSHAYMYGPSLISQLETSTNTCFPHRRIGNPN